MKDMKVDLQPLKSADIEQFVLDCQWAFKYGATEEFGLRDQHYEEDGEIISKDTILASIECGAAYRIICDGEIVGGLVLRIEMEQGKLELLFVKPEYHSQGMGYIAWSLVEKMFPDVKVWETYTPYFETRNIHFYVNRCGFHIVEFYNENHANDFIDCADGMFRFEKVMNNEDSDRRR